MNGLSDSLSIGILITLVFGALFFYLYSRQLQNEKRTGLIERMLLDLKMSAENLWSNLSVVPAPTQSNGGIREEREDREEIVDKIKPVSEPFPLESEDVDEEDLAAAAAAVTEPAEEQNLVEMLAATMAPTAEQPVARLGGSTSAADPPVQANYSSMTLKELKQAAKQRGLVHSHNAGKREITDLLQKADSGKTVETPAAGSLLGADTADLVTDFEPSS